MSDSNPVPTHPLLNSFALGPAWARATAGDRDHSSAKQPKPAKQDDNRPNRRETSADAPPRRDGRDPKRGRDGFEGRDSRGGFRDRDGNRPPYGGNKGGKFQDRRDAPPRREEIFPAENVLVTLIPDPQAVHLIGSEIRQVARVYPLFDVAKILLAERGRCQAVFEANPPHPGFYLQFNGESLFLTREEAVAHLWNSDLRKEYLDEDIVEVDPPAGNFQLVARCGMSGEWLGPPNYHAYQTNLRRLHREQFSHVPFAVYSSRVRTERGEEAVNAWLETMKQKKRWRIKGDPDDAWTDDRSTAERQLTSRCFDQAYSLVPKAIVSAAIPPKHLSPALFASLKACGNHARNHPAVLIPAACRALESEHLPVFKRQGKIFTGPARPLPLPPNAVLAERPGIMVNWIRANKPAKLEGLWQAVLPEGGTAPPADFAADLFWLLLQGHVLLFTDDTLVVQDLRDSSPPQNSTPTDSDAPAKKRKKKKKSKSKSPTGEASSQETTTSSEEASPDSEEPAPTPEDSAPISEEPAPATGDSAPISQEPAPAPEDSAPISEKPALAPEEPAPTPEEPNSPALP